jgi:Na+-translocating ferredoxin:NAD+ oxidoreductase RnfD subunit
MINLKSIRTQMIIFLSALASYLSVRDRDAAFLFSVIIAVVFCAGTESVIEYIRNKKFSLTDSSIISGLIIGYVLSSDNAWRVIALASVFAIASKKLIRINGKHLFNPAATGIFLVTILFGATTQWRATYMWHILIPAGMYFTYKTKKTEIILSYGLVAFGLFGIQAILQKASLLSIFGYLSYFYIFVMVIEPKTTPLRPRAKYIFGACLSGLVFVLNNIGVRFDAELCSLLVMNAFVPFLNRF